MLWPSPDPPAALASSKYPCRFLQSSLGARDQENKSTPLDLTQKIPPCASWILLGQSMPVQGDQWPLRPVECLRGFHDASPVQGPESNCTRSVRTALAPAAWCQLTRGQQTTAGKPVAATKADMTWRQMTLHQESLAPCLRVYDSDRTI